MECITLWDVRAKASVYDLATGNNSVSGMAWNDERNELVAATYCRSVDRNGCHFDYGPAKIPVEKDDDDEEEEDDEEDWVDEDEDDKDEEVEYQDTDQCWPGSAYHNETYFGHIFDSGDHRICTSLSSFSSLDFKFTGLIQIDTLSRLILTLRLYLKMEVRRLEMMVGSELKYDLRTCGIGASLLPFSHVHYWIYIQCFW